MPALGSLLAAPAWAATLLADRFELAMACLLVEYLLAENWIGPTVAVLQASLPPAALGTAQGIFSGLTAVGNVAPAAVGVLVADGAGVPLRDALLVIVCGAYVLAAVAFTLMGASMPDEREAAADPARGGGDGPGS